MTTYTRHFAGDIEIEYNTESGDVFLYNGHDEYIAFSEEGIRREDIVIGVRLLERIDALTTGLSETTRGLVYTSMIDFLRTHVRLGKEREA